MRLSFTMVLVSFLYASSWSQDIVRPTEHFARERTYHVLHYKLNINIAEKEKVCEGEINIKLVPLRPQFDEVRLDVAEMNVTQVRLEWQPLEFHLRGETLFITLDKSYSLEDTLNLLVSYSVAAPKKGLYFIQPDSGYSHKQWQVWSQGEAEDNHYWFPCYDFPNDMATSEMIVTVNERFTAISNGKLVDVKENPKRHTATFHWFEGKSHASYLISLVVGEYVDLKDSCGTIPIDNYVYKFQSNDAMRSFGKTAKMIEFYSSKIGYPYPWEKYAQTVVQDFIYGGEENVSATTLTDATIHDARAHLDYSSDGLVAHELAHMWWGDLLTCRDWSHAWLNEGFATYFGNVFTEFDRGRDAAAKELLDNQITVRNVDVGIGRRPTVCNRYINPMDLFDNRIYGKGAVVLNMLRFYLGDELFWKAISHYVHRYAYQNVETNDFKIAVEEATGYNLHWFFVEWLHKAGYPEFEITSHWDQQNRSIQLTVRQTQMLDSLTGIFTMPVDIEVWVGGVPKTYRVLISNKEEVFSFPAYQQPQLVIFDKGSKLLKKVDFKKSVDEWIYQLERASDGVDRLLAIDELQWFVDSSVVIDALSKAMLDDAFSEVRRAAVWSLGEVKRTDVSEKLIAAYGDREAAVRAASVISLGSRKGENVLSTLRHAFERDSSYSVVAAALRSLAKVDSANRKAYCSEGLKRDSRNEIIRSTALQILAQIGDDESLNLIKSYTQYGVDRNLRIQCVNMLASIWKTRDDVVSYLISMLKDPSFQVRRVVIEILGTLGNPQAIEELEKSVARESDSRLVKEAREAIAKIQQVQQHE